MLRTKNGNSLFQRFANNFNRIQWLRSQLFCIWLESSSRNLERSFAMIAFLAYLVWDLVGYSVLRDVLRLIDY
ncbi:high light inducible protein [uncultured Nostoc sp.]|uniref:high light inducible protein n=1 Tax=uncultured Nostoc sp. TaxID=340711 RepID=UPI0035C9E1D3